MNLEFIKKTLEILSLNDYKIDDHKKDIILSQNPSITINYISNSSITMRGKLPYDLLSKIEYQFNIRFWEICNKTYCICIGDWGEEPENLLIFLSCLKDYFNPDTKMPTNISNLDRNLKEVINFLANQMNLALSLDEWLTSSSMSKIQESIEEDKSTIFGRYFRNALTDFDQMVNPSYIDAKDFLKDYIDGKGKIKFHWSDMGEKGIVSFSYHDSKKGIKTAFERSADCFQCYLSVSQRANQEYQITHQITKEDGEKICVYRKDNEKIERRVYQLTYGTFAKDENAPFYPAPKPNRPMTPLERDQLYDQLVQVKKIIDEDVMTKVQENPALQYVYRNPKVRSKKSTS